MEEEKPEEKKPVETKPVETKKVEEVVVVKEEKKESKIKTDLESLVC